MVRDSSSHPIFYKKQSNCKFYFQLREGQEQALKELDVWNSTNLFNYQVHRMGTKEKTNKKQSLKYYTQAASFTALVLSFAPSER